MEQKKEGFEPEVACLRLAKSRLRRLLACMAPAGAHAAQVESLTLRHVAEVRYLNTTFS